MEHAASLLPKGKSWQLAWNDEFDGDTLDRSKWDFRLHLLQHRHPTFTDEGVVVKDGCAHLNLIERDGHFFSPHLQTGYNYLDRPGNSFCFGGQYTWPISKLREHKFLHAFGYYECRARLQQNPGWWSAFWLQSPVIGCCLDPAMAGVEIDIMENFTRDRVVSSNLHWNGYGDDHQSAGSGPVDAGETADGFHLFGCEWSEAGYTFYVDGRQTAHFDGPVSRQPQFILISTECMGYRTDGKPDPLLKGSVPDAFVVDFVRVYEAIPT